MLSSEQNYNTFVHDQSTQKRATWTVGGLILGLLGVFCVLLLVYLPNREVPPEITRNQVEDEDFATSSNKIVFYWGQDPAGSRGETSEKNLAYYCELGDNYDVINIAFVDIFFDNRNKDQYPSMDLANHGDKCASFDGYPGLLNCADTVGKDIKTCQSLGKKVLISLGGTAGIYGFQSSSKAVLFANTIWNLFLGGASSVRPFGDAILDGIDLDIEAGSGKYYGDFLRATKTLMATSTPKKDYYISGSPQCPFPDYIMGPGTDTVLTEVGQLFSWISVQYFNNYCYVGSGDEFSESLSKWNEAAKKSGYQVLVGVPAAKAASSGTKYYTSASTLCGLLPTLRTYEKFGGFMGWDASFDMNNNDFELSKGLRACLGTV